ncbi:MAG TPA: metallophosphoesterase [Gammaproteobacteria bacterium]|nr:metallophosphoesterase [Gammaproteobacteria bacterium]
MSKIIQLLIFSFVFFLSFSAYAELSTKKLSQTQAFLVLADLHFDPFLACKNKPCPLLTSLEEAPITEWKGIFLQQDRTVMRYGKDSNYYLLESALAAAKKEAELAAVSFVLVLGDLLAHDYEQKFFSYSSFHSEAAYQSFVKKTLAFLEQEFNHSFPKTDVYWTVGNNDSYQEDYAVEPGGLFFKDFSLIEAPLIKTKNNRSSFLREFPRGGYYAINAPRQPGLRLLFINSVLFSTKATGPQLEEAAKEQLEWLDQELNQAQKRQQKILLAMHIPLGIDVYTTLLIPFSLVEFWKPVYSQRFLAELSQTAAELLGVLPAHTHADAFQILSLAHHQALPFISTPSISPLFGNNPAFKIYRYSLPDLRLSDFTTYYLALDKKQGWKKEYDFSEAYQLKEGEDLSEAILQLQPQGSLAEHYKVFYAVNSNSQPLTKYNKWFPYYWCAIRNLTAATYRSCLGEKFSLSQRQK